MLPIVEVILIFLLKAIFGLHNRLIEFYSSVFMQTSHNYNMLLLFWALLELSFESLRYGIFWVCN